MNGSRNMLFASLLVAIIVMLSMAGCSAPMLLDAGSERASDPSLSAIQEKGVLVVGTDAPYGVMEFYDDAGELIGIDMDIADEIAANLGVTVEAVTMPFDDLFGAVKNQDVDVVISAVTITPERQEEMRFSVPYLDAGMLVAVRNDNEEIQSLDDLKDKRVGVLKGTVGEDLALSSDYFDPALVISYPTSDERIADLLAGEIDASIVHFLVKDQYPIKTVGRPLSQSFYGVVTALENESLMDEINTVLREMQRDGRLTEITQTYLSE